MNAPTIPRRAGEPLTRLLLAPLTDRAVREQARVAAYVVASAAVAGRSPSPEYVEAVPA